MEILNKVQLLSLLILFSLVSFEKSEEKIHSNAKDFKAKDVVVVTTSLANVLCILCHLYTTCPTSNLAQGQGCLSIKQTYKSFFSQLLFITSGKCLGHFSVFTKEI